jgi:hypothetical protein
VSGLSRLLWRNRALRATATGLKNAFVLTGSLFPYGGAFNTGNSGVPKEATPDERKTKICSFARHPTTIGHQARLSLLAVRYPAASVLTCLAGAVLNLLE